jgi:hypothetical protein
MSAATLAKRARRVYPLPFNACSPKVQERIIEKWRDDPDNCWPRWDEVDQVTEMLEEVLSYEFGIRVLYRATKYDNDKSASEPDLQWSICNPLEVTFTSDLDIDDLLKHGAPGCEYFNADIAALRELIDAATVAEFLMLLDLDWTFSLTENEYHPRAEYSSNDRGMTAQEQEPFDKLAEAMGRLLARIYKTACGRCEQVLERENDYRCSDECIREYLEDCDCKFERDGSLA